MSKVIIYGYSDLGYKIAKILKAQKYDVIIVDVNEENYSKSLEDGFSTYKYSLLKDEELFDIGINDENTKAFFCVSNNENNNFFVTLSARNLNNNIKIISKASNESDSRKMMLAGSSKVINPYLLGSLRVFLLLQKPLISKVLDRLFFEDSNLNIEEFEIKKESLLNGKFLNDFTFSKDFNIIVIGIADKELSDKFIFNASGINHKLDVQDTIVAVGYKNDLEKFRIFVEGEENI